jgi:predicted NBD/HSP70 family sugar kinase
LKEDFTAAYALAHKGDHGAQVTVAFCLSTGCRGAVIIDKVAACSWHIVIANSGAATVIDGSNLKDTCRPMTEEQKAAARALSHDLVRKIYNRPVAVADQM